MNLSVHEIKRRERQGQEEMRKEFEKVKKRKFDMEPRERGNSIPAKDEGL